MDMDLNDDEDDFLAEKQEEQVEPIKEPTVETVVETPPERKKGKTKLVLKDKKIVEEKTDKISESPSIGELAEENRRLQEENSKLTDLLNAQPKMQEIQKEDKKETVSSLLNKLYGRVKEQRTILLLEALKENYFKLKYKSFSVTEIQKMNQQISEKFLAQSLEGKVKAIINANEE